MKCFGIQRHFESLKLLTIWSFGWQFEMISRLHGESKIFGSYLAHDCVRRWLVDFRIQQLSNYTVLKCFRYVSNILRDVWYGNEHPVCGRVRQEEVFQGNLKNSGNIKKAFGYRDVLQLLKREKLWRVKSQGRIWHEIRPVWIWGRKPLRGWENLWAEHTEWGKLRESRFQILVNVKGKETSWEYINFWLMGVYIITLKWC